MFSTCLFCHRSLGRNDVVEYFPVGRRLAFDSAKGRLWVVCRRCGRWNLSPLEERWEAIEECERLFRETPLRASTEEIALARTRSELDLVRIGRPHRPEFAAWRYGDQLGRRMRRGMMQGAAFGISAAAFQSAVGASIAGATLLAMPTAFLVAHVPALIYAHRQRRRVIARARGDQNEEMVIRRWHTRSAALVPAESGGSWALRIEHDRGGAVLTGKLAEQTAAKVMASVNHVGASRRAVARAVSGLEAAGGPEALLQRLARRGVPDPNVKATNTLIPTAGLPADSLWKLSEPDRLAIEMAVNEENERRAMDGELATLAAAWHDAEEIAAIADDLALPADVHARFEWLKRSPAPSPPP